MKSLNFGGKEFDSQALSSKIKTNNRISRCYE